MSSSSKGKCMRRQTRETIAKVYSFLKRDATEIIKLVSNPQWTSEKVLLSKLSEHLNKVRKRTAEAVGVSERTITNILAEGKESVSKCKSPFKEQKIKLELDDDVISSTIDNYHLEFVKVENYPGET